MSTNATIRCSVEVSTKIAGCCDPGSFRHMQHVLVTKRSDDSVFLTATDGRAMAIAKASGRLDSAAEFLPGKALPNGPAKAELNGEWRVTTGKRATKITTHPAAEPGRYPNAASILSTVDHSDSFRFLRIDAALLKKLADAICSEDSMVTLIIEEPETRVVDKPIRVIGSDGIGMIMPCELEKRDSLVATFNATAEAYKASFAQPK